MNNAGLEARGEDPRDLPDEPHPAGRRRGVPRGLALLLLLLLVFSCTSASYGRAPVVPETVLELGPSERADEQRRSLRHVFYRNNDTPPPPSTREIRKLERDLDQAPEVEVSELRELFGNDLELLTYATRDTDGDGVLDFRISEYRGKFFEGDIDLDGDGIRNVFDAAPYDKNVGGTDTDGDGTPDQPGSFADRDGDSIPDHLDWSKRKSGSMPALQTSLFRDFGVILVERSARFSPELVQAIDDTMRYVFREPIPTLRTVAVEDQLLISPDLGDNGFMLGQTQTLTICVDPLEGASPLVMFGLVIHEVAHAWQLAQDFDAEDLVAENRKIHFPRGEFTNELERFGWAHEPDSHSQSYEHQLYWPHFYATSPRYAYRGYAPNEWAAWFEDLQHDHGSDFLRTSEAKTWGIIGPYSLTSPWEWHADHLMAAVYNRMDESLATHPNHTYRSVSGVLSERMLDTVQHQWSRFDYRNGAGTSIDRELGQHFKLSDAQAQVLVDRYVIPLVDPPMLVEAFAVEAAPAGGVGGLVASFGETWTELREQVELPVDELSRLPSLSMLDKPWRPATPAAPTSASRERDLARNAESPAAEASDAEQPSELSESDPLAEPAPEPDTSSAPIRPERLREALEHATPTPLGGRHGAGQVGGVVGQPTPAAAIISLTPAELSEPEPEPELPTAPSTQAERPDTKRKSKKNRRRTDGSSRAGH